MFVLLLIVLYISRTAWFTRIKRNTLNKQARRDAGFLFGGMRNLSHKSLILRELRGCGGPRAVTRWRLGSYVGGPLLFRQNPITWTSRGKSNSPPTWCRESWAAFSRTSTTLSRCWMVSTDISICSIVFLAGRECVDESCWDNIHRVTWIAALTIVKRFYGFGVIAPPPVVVAT